MLAGTNSTIGCSCRHAFAFLFNINGQTEGFPSCKPNNQAEGTADVFTFNASDAGTLCARSTFISRTDWPGRVVAGSLPSAHHV
jgi:hypothetical protein